MSYLQNVPVLTDRKKILLLSFTWGLPVSLVGCLYAAAMLMTGHKPKRFGPCVYFECGHNWGGADCGWVFVVQKDASPRLLHHEMGHCFQNCKFGLLMPFLVSIPSTCRYWYRRIYTAVTKKYPGTDYDDIWFEGQATRLGYEYMRVTKE